MRKVKKGDREKDKRWIKREVEYTRGWKRGKIWSKLERYRDIQEWEWGDIKQERTKQYGIDKSVKERIGRC